MPPAHGRINWSRRYDDGDDAINMTIKIYDDLRSCAHRVLKQSGTRTRISRCRNGTTDGWNTAKNIQLPYVCAHTSSSIKNIDFFYPSLTTTGPCDPVHADDLNTDSIRKLFLTDFVLCELFFYRKTIIPFVLPLYYFEKEKRTFTTHLLAMAKKETNNEPDDENAHINVFQSFTVIWDILKIPHMKILVMAVLTAAVSFSVLIQFFYVMQFDCKTTDGIYMVIIYNKYDIRSGNRGHNYYYYRQNCEF